MYEHSPLLEAVMLNIERYSKKTAIVMNGKSISYEELGQNIIKSAVFLKELGIHAGDKIILSAHKDIEYISLYFGAHVIGAINVIVDVESNKKRLQYIEDKVKPSLCFGYRSDKFPSKSFSEINQETKSRVLNLDSEIKTTDIAEILFTTGTTGAPKGVCLSYLNIYSSASNINEFIGNQEDDIELLGLPICHSFGLGRIRCCLLKGATIVILSNFANVRTFLKTIEQYNVTGFGVVPAAWAYIRKMSGSRISKYANQIRYIELGSAAMPLETKKEMLELFPNTRICMHYGLTEASRNCFLEFHDTEHINSIGKPVCSKVNVKIFSELGKELPFGQQGEICVKGNMVMSHYLDEMDTVNAFWGDYFRTGDTGYQSEEGYIYLLGREKELINVGGKKVSPMEVEDTICSLGVGDCVCVPMKDPNGVMGELVKCFILKGSTTLSFEEIANALIGKLEPYKRPAAYEWVDVIPQTPSGKKQRINLI